jgi:cytochrome c peroxidase
MNKVAVIIAFLFILVNNSCDKFGDTQSLSSTPFNPSNYELIFPDDFPEMEIPPDNPLTREGVALGRQLFYDPILSADSSMACASCHHAALIFTDNKAFIVGIDGQAGRRSAMSLLNLGFNKSGFFWDGRVATLEAQALVPVEDSIELHNNWDTLVEKIKVHNQYPLLFRKAFGIETVAEINKEMAVKAIAQFERTLISSGKSKFDKVKRGETEFTPDELIGFDMFFDISPEYKDAECAHCHNVPLMTTNEYFNNGITAAINLEDFQDKGLGGITGSRFDIGKFKAPTLRNIELTAPYMHDGRFETLEEVIEHYSSGGKYSETVSPLIRPLKLNEIEKRQILAFLKTLTDTTFIKNPEIQAPNYN